MTAEALLEELNSDAAYVERQQEKARRVLQRESEWRTVFAPYAAAINQAGYSGDTLHDILANNTPLDPPIVKILLRAVTEIHAPRDAEMIVRALAASGVPYNASALAELFEKTDDESLKWACINTIATSTATHIDKWLTELPEYWLSVLRDCRNRQT